MEHEPEAPNFENEKLPGADALSAYLKKSYGRKPDGELMPAIGAALTGAAIDHVVYYAEDTEKPHWDFITFGMSELGEKQSDNPEVSGEGYEFTLRLARDEQKKSPHEWPMRFFNDIGDQALSGDAPFQMYDYVELEGGLDAPQENAYVGALLAPDSLLAKTHTPNGTVAFLQIVPIRASELEAVKKLAEGVTDEASSEVYEAEVKKILATLMAQETKLLITDFSETD